MGYMRTNLDAEMTSLFKQDKVISLGSLKKLIETLQSQKDTHKIKLDDLQAERLTQIKEKELAIQQERTKKQCYKERQ